MSGAFELRAYRDADHAEWLRMRRALWPEIAREREVEDGAEWLARDDATVLVAERAAGGLCGFAEVAERPYAEGCETSPVTYLEGWWVDADVRRAGVGAALVRAAEDWGRSRGRTEMGSDVLLDNDVSHTAHRALGFDEVERLVMYRKSL
ncbi:GNAT family N-acetyltransferase [Roseisolibacter sp. H3M3-2]|uniref:GNAT family N-acetyltransferase n=1 Tax=Roseisolibacter sp. H3M3-2 TaxID=3031323 RepID=UPI0023DB44E2|nr:GNAT family N-acetyltransferase [Roseisolibacter sp. H3M3-2]MDF1503053.1 GNAT family N-acetyltransferase [Roseisolibacter sp. H3M3-2]